MKYILQFIKSSHSLYFLIYEAIIKLDISSFPCNWFDYRVQACT